MKIKIERTNSHQMYVLIHFGNFFRLELEALNFSLKLTVVPIISEQEAHIFEKQTEKFEITK